MQVKTIVEARNLTRNYSRHVAVDNISFDLKKGEVLGLLGPNGAGKSTTLLMLSGNLAPSKGQVIIDGFDLFLHPLEAKANIGFLSEKPPLYADLNVDEYLKYSARLRGLSNIHSRQQRNKVKKLCGLEQVSRKLISQLSHGYQQRVGIAQAIIHEPPIVILDEPTSGLDPIQIQEIRELIKELGQRHAVILSSHILPEVQSTCDRVLIINQGQIIYNESLQSNEHHNELLVGFDAPPQLNQLSELDGVLSCEMVDDRFFLIEHKNQNEFAKSLVDLSCQHHWQLFELAPKQKSLEDIFLDIMQYSTDKTQ